ncbi:hypothetical protein [Halorientalis salina]|uniref:hypothetical protein n=1 Tax=Halorientalis salina TaxID=2932266 RepID=UPI0010AC4810|nr:hypothetical protein [Halorientalis salina]
MTVLLFVVPGALELAVILLVAVLLLGIPLLVLLGVASGLTLLGADDEDIDDLRDRVDELEAQIAAENSGEGDERTDDRERN